MKNIIDSTKSSGLKMRRNKFFKNLSKNLLGFLALAFAALIIFLMILTACGSRRGDNMDTNGRRNFEDSVFNYFQSVITDDGAYFLDTSAGGILNFYDIKTDKTVVVCNKVNCRHEKSGAEMFSDEICRAELKNPLILAYYRENFYTLEFTLQKSAGELPGFSYILTVSDPDRSAQKSLGPAFSAVPNTILFHGNYAYISMEDIERKETEQGNLEPTGKSTGMIKKLNLDSGECSDFYTGETGYNASVRIIGAADNKLYFVNSYAEKQVYIKFEGSSHTDYSDPSIFKAKLLAKNFDESDKEAVQISDSRLFGGFERVLGNGIFYSEAKVFMKQEGLNYYRRNRSDGKEKLLFEAKNILAFWDNKILYENYDDGKIRLYLLEEVRDQEYPIQDAELIKTYYGIYQYYPSAYCFALKKTVLEDNQFNFSPLLISENNFLEGKLNSAIDLLEKKAD